MFTRSLSWTRKASMMIASVGILVVMFLGGLPAAHSQELGKAKKKIPAVEQSTKFTSPPYTYFTSRTITLPGGVLIDEDTISGPPAPPPGYELERSAVALPKPERQMGINTLTVPAYNWVFGCSAVSAAMIAGYLDRNGYPNMYTGPTDGGVMPLNNSSWGNWTDSAGATYPNIPLAASHQGVDGRATRGSIDDYWIEYDSSAIDPFIVGNWTQHAWGDAIGDYMKTSQSSYGNTDGSTKFYTWTSSTTPLTCSDMVDYDIDVVDGTYGRKLFYEARGYTVTDCYNQKTDNDGGGFTFAMYKAEIDAGRPVFLNLEGHSIVGVGYNDSSSPATLYIHDTWDYGSHTMYWGGSYAGMALRSVSIVNLSGGAATVPTVTTTTVTSITANSAVSGGNVTSNGGAPPVTDRGVCWSTSSNPTTSDACTHDSTGTGSFTSSITGLASGTTYHVRAFATNSIGTGYGGDLTFSTMPAGCGGYTMSRPTYAFEDISATGTNLNQGDDTYRRFGIPFTFKFYGRGYTTVSVGSNGTIYFTDKYLGFLNTDIPISNGYGVNEFIAPFWDDLSPGDDGDGDVRWQVLGTAPNRRLVVQWTGVPHYDSIFVDAATFQAVLYEGTNDIRFNYQDVQFGSDYYDNGASATIGIQRDGTCGMKFSYDTPSVVDSSSILFSTGAVRGRMPPAILDLLLY